MWTWRKGWIVGVCWAWTKGNNGRERKANRSRTLPAPQEECGGVSRHSHGCISYTFWIHLFNSHGKISPMVHSSRLSPVSVSPLLTMHSHLSSSEAGEWASGGRNSCQFPSIRFSQETRFYWPSIRQVHRHPDLLLHRLHVLTEKEFMSNQAVHSHTTLNAPDAAADTQWQQWKTVGYGQSHTW